MQLELNADEQELLSRILDEHLKELRGEIVRTKDYNVKQTLKSEEGTIRVLML
jgi:hypothetical protein